VAVELAADVEVLALVAIAEMALVVDELALVVETADDPVDPPSRKREY